MLENENQNLERCLARDNANHSNRAMDRSKNNYYLPICLFLTGFLGLHRDLNHRTLLA